MAINLDHNGLFPFVFTSSQLCGVGVFRSEKKLLSENVDYVSVVVLSVE